MNILSRFYTTIFTISFSLLLASCEGDSLSTSDIDATGSNNNPPPGDTEVTYEPYTAPSNDLFASLPASGSVTVALHPGATVQIGQTTRFAFGVPFPRNTINNINNIRVIDNTTEVPANITEVTRWRSISGDTSVNSIRSVLVFMDYVFDSTDPVQLQIEYGVARTQNLAVTETVKDTWVNISNGPNSDEFTAVEGIEEPNVYATLPPEWLSACVLRTRTLPLNTASSIDSLFNTNYSDVDNAVHSWDTNMDWFDNAYVNFGKTMVNDVPDYVTDAYKVHYDVNDPYLSNPVEAAAPWLFDRTLALFGLYIRTGEVKWLRHAHRAAQYYNNHIDSAGYLDYRGWDDLKYSYGQGFLIDMILTGDQTLLTNINNVALAASTGWDPVYEFTDLFWTERHHTYALLAALSAWEATGTQAYADRATSIIQTTLNHQLNPVNGWAYDGGLLHTLTSHEGDSNAFQPVASPWMTALLGDAIFRYYLHSDDQDALTILSNMGDWLLNYGLFDATPAHPILSGLIMPYYLVSSTYVSDDGTFGEAWDDKEHACDVAGLVAKSAYARAQLGYDPAQLKTAASDLLYTCYYATEYWTRPGTSGPSNPQPSYRLNPPRKFNWWFGTTSDIEWLLDNS